MITRTLLLFGAAATAATVAVGAADARSDDASGRLFKAMLERLNPPEPPSEGGVAGGGCLGNPAGATCGGDAEGLKFPLSDGIWTVVPFSANGAQGSGPASAADPCQRNDDDFARAGSGMPAVPFNFDFYGTVFTGDQIFINNNGNLSFGAGFTTFTSSGFPINNFPMVAPFWADVDTRVNATNPNSGVAWYQYRDDNGDGNIETLVVTWENVGYYSVQSDKLNTFQVAISDGTNPLMGLGNNVCFSYDKMCWTTGSASQGQGGFGGVPATVGANKGDGVNFFQIGRFNAPGDAYNGPNTPSGVEWLDDQDFCFNTSFTENVAPIAIGVPPGNKLTADVLLEQCFNSTIQFIGPETPQSVSVAVADPNGAQAAGLVVTSTPGNPASVNLAWCPDCDDAGTYTIVLTATDNGVPPESTTVTIQLNVLCDVGCPWDLNEDGTVDGADLGLLLANWGFPGIGDFNENGAVGPEDLADLIGNWGNCP